MIRSAINHANFISVESTKLIVYYFIGLKIRVAERPTEKGLITNSSLTLHTFIDSYGRLDMLISRINFTMAGISPRNEDYIHQEILKDMIAQRMRYMLVQLSLRSINFVEFLPHNRPFSRCLIPYRIVEPDRFFT